VVSLRAPAQVAADDADRLVADVGIRRLQDLLLRLRHVVLGLRRVRLRSRARLVGLALHHRAVAAADTAGQQIVGRQSLHHAIGHGVGVLLVCVADLADAALQVHPGALLYDVSGLVRGGMHTGWRGERYLIALGVGLRADLGRSRRSRSADVAADSRQVVARAERSLDGLEVGQRARAAGHATIGDLVDARRGRRFTATFSGGLAVAESLGQRAATDLGDRRASVRLNRAARADLRPVVRGIAAAFSPLPVVAHVLEAMATTSRRQRIVAFLIIGLRNPIRQQFCGYAVRKSGHGTRHHAIREWARPVPSDICGPKRTSKMHVGPSYPAQALRPTASRKVGPKQGRGRVGRRLGRCYAREEGRPTTPRVAAPQLLASQRGRGDLCQRGV
jgi:hypothetical protein